MEVSRNLVKRLKRNGNHRSVAVKPTDEFGVSWRASLAQRILSGLLVLAGALGSAPPTSAAELLAPGAKLVQVASDYEFTEGPAVDREGNVYFTDQPNDRILKWELGGKITTFLQPCGRSNGLFFDHQGHLLACADEKNELWRITPAGEHEVLLKDFEGKRLNGPNDLWVRPDGGIYFTDPYYQRPYWKHQKAELDVQGVYFFDPVQRTVKRVAATLEQPNGIIGTPDGKTLYVADIRAGKTYAFQIAADGSLSDQRLFCELGSDGMTIDSAGNVYLTGRGVTVFSAAGEKIEHIEVPAGWTANVTFGGPDRRTLFITASKSVFTLAMQVSGVGAPATPQGPNPSDAQQ